MKFKKSEMEITNEMFKEMNKRTKSLFEALVGEFWIFFCFFF